MAARLYEHMGDRVFRSVFPSINTFSQPTPAINSAAPGQPFGPPSFANFSFSGRHEQGLNQSQQQVVYDRAWHAVTTFLALPDVPISTFQDFGNTETSRPNELLLESLRDVLAPDVRLPQARNTEDLLQWHANQIRRHFIHRVIPHILEHSKRFETHEDLIEQTVATLDITHRKYQTGLATIVEQLLDARPLTSRPVFVRFRRDLHAIICNSVATKVPFFLSSLRIVLANAVATILGLPLRNDLQSAGTLGSRSYGTTPVELVRGRLLELVEALYTVGLGGESFQVMFAEVMNNVLAAHVQETYEGKWAEREIRPVEESVIPRSIHQTRPSQNVADLCEWVGTRFARVVVEVFGKLGGLHASHTELDSWKHMAIERLVQLRISELYDIALAWPEASGALDDLRTAVVTPQQRVQLTDVFNDSIKHRLLHPGSSTLQMLRAYIAIIFSFHALDHTKVLLDRVAFPLKMYLCQREDTVRIVITGLLSTPSKDSGGKIVESGGEKLSELAILLDQRAHNNGHEADEELDWNDMDWLPAPVDAGPSYRRSKSADIIGTLISDLGPPDQFIREFQNIIGDHLLKNDGDFEKEIRVLELLKQRFTEALLQNCEVMVKDIQDSRRVNAMIRRIGRLDPSEEEIEATRASDGSDVNAEGLLKPSLHAKILSRLYWPTLRDETHLIPAPIANLQKRYAQGFESLKSARKLTWLPALGLATVELEFEDRVVFEEVHTWQASVIWAFQSEEGDEAVQHSVQQLVEQLEMDESLVRSALTFWVSKLVLRETTPDTFIVLETLNQEDLERSNAQTSNPPISGMGASQGSAEDEAEGGGAEDDGRMDMYWQFIKGMLTNSAQQMPLAQIAMMLNMLIADGFPYSNEDLAELLGGKVRAGELEVSGGKYKLKK